MKKKLFRNKCSRKLKLLKEIYGTNNNKKQEIEFCEEEINRTGGQDEQ